MSHHEARYDPREAIQTLRRKGVHLWVQDGLLRYRAPRGLITDQDVAMLRMSDSALILRILTEADSQRFEPRALPRAHPTRAPLAFSQLSHWRLRGPSGHRPIRQVTSATNLRGRLDSGAFEEAASAIMDRHEALRTQIVDAGGGTPMQQVSQHGRQYLQVIDISAAPVSNRRDVVEEQIARAIGDVFDYALDPLFRLVLLKLRKEESVLIVAADHMISDGMSLSIIFDELLTMYAQLKHRNPVSLPPLRMQFADYSVWQNTELSSLLKVRASDHERWRRTRFPDSPATQDESGWGTVPLILDACLKKALHEWARRQRISLVLAALVAYVALVLRWCNVPETLIQVMSDGRGSKHLENTVGYLAFPHYLQASIDKGDTFLDLLEKILRDYCRACEQPDFYYSYTCDPRPSFTRNSCFNWLPSRPSFDDFAPKAGGESLARSNVPFKSPVLETLELDSEPMVLFRETDAEIIGAVSFPRKRFSAENMARFATNYRRFLDVLIKDPMSQICDVAMI